MCCSWSARVGLRGGRVAGWAGPGSRGGGNWKNARRRIRRAAVRRGTGRRRMARGRGRGFGPGDVGDDDGEEARGSLARTCGGSEARAEGCARGRGAASWSRSPRASVDRRRKEVDRSSTGRFLSARASRGRARASDRYARNRHAGRPRSRIGHPRFARSAFPQPWGTSRPARRSWLYPRRGGDRARTFAGGSARPGRNHARAAMMSLAASASAAAPARVVPAGQRNTRIHACASPGVTSLGAGRAMGGASAGALRARARAAPGARRRVVAPVRAKTLEERIASGEFTKPRSSPLLGGLNGLRDAIKKVSPQSACRPVARPRVSDRPRAPPRDRPPPPPARATPEFPGCATRPDAPRAPTPRTASTLDKALPRLFSRALILPSLPPVLLPLPQAAASPTSSPSSAASGATRT